MKRFLTAFIFMLLVAPAGFAREQSVLARVTVYWASGGGGSDHWTRRHICSTGARLRAGHCAVDPRRIPYGSKVTLPDATLLAVDTGSAVRSRKAARRSGRTALERNALVVDRFFETKQHAGLGPRNPTSAVGFAARFPVLATRATQSLPPNSRPRKNASTPTVTPASVQERQKSSRYAR